VTMRLLAEQLLNEEAGTTYVDGELVSMRLKALPPPKDGHMYHVCCSRWNNRALLVLDPSASGLPSRAVCWLLAGPVLTQRPMDRDLRPQRARSRSCRKLRKARFRNISLQLKYQMTPNSRLRRTERRATEQDKDREGFDPLGAVARIVRRTPRSQEGLLVTTDFSRIAECDHMLLYLTSQTWTRGASSEALAEEVRQAMDLGVHVLLVHESEPSQHPNSRAPPFVAPPARVSRLRQIVQPHDERCVALVGAGSQCLGWEGRRHAVAVSLAPSSHASTARHRPTCSSAASILRSQSRSRAGRGAR
jgi:hypothetical protein